MPQFSVLENREQLCMQSQPVSRSKKTEYDIFFRIVKEQPTHSTRNDAQATSSELACASSLGSVTDFRGRKVVEVNGIEPMTPCLQSRCSPS